MRPGGSRDLAGAALVTAAIALCAVTAFFDEPYRRDLKLPVHMGLLESGYSYRELFVEHLDVQPPGIYWLLTLLRKTGLSSAICSRFVSLAGLAGSALLVAWHLRRAAPKASPAAAALCILAVGSAQHGLMSKSESFAVLFLVSAQMVFLFRHLENGGAGNLVVSYLALALAGLFKAHMPFFIYLGVLVTARVFQADGYSTTIRRRIRLHLCLAVAAFALSFGAACVVFRGDIGPAVYNAALRGYSAVYYPVSLFTKPLQGHGHVLHDLPSGHWWEALAVALLVGVSTPLDAFMFAYPFSLFVPAAAACAIGGRDLSGARGDAALWLMGGMCTYAALVHNGEGHFMLYLLPSAAVLLAHSADANSDDPGFRPWARLWGAGILVGGAVLAALSVARLCRVDALAGAELLGKVSVSPHRDGLISLFDLALGLLFVAAGLAMTVRKFGRPFQVRSMVAVLALGVVGASAAAAVRVDRIAPIPVFFAAVNAQTRGEAVGFGDGVDEGYGRFLDRQARASVPGMAGGGWTLLDEKRRAEWQSDCLPPVVASGIFPSTGDSLLLSRCRPRGAR